MNLVFDGLNMSIYFLEIEIKNNPDSAILKAVLTDLKKLQEDLFDYCLLSDEVSKSDSEVSKSDI